MPSFESVDAVHLPQQRVQLGQRPVLAEPVRSGGLGSRRGRYSIGTSKKVKAPTERPFRIHVPS